MPLMTDQQLCDIVGVEHMPYWKLTPYRAYNKAGSPWGVITLHSSADLTVVISAAKENSFTVGMLRDIIRLYNHTSVCLVTDEESAQTMIAKVLSDYEFEYVYEYINGKKFMYSIHRLKEEV